MRFSRYRMSLTMPAVIALAALLSQSSARAQTFDFEELDLTVFSITPVISTKGGITATITRFGPGGIHITDTNAPVPWGDRSIVPHDATGSMMIINFSVPVTSVSIQAGDFAADDDSPITLTAFSSADGGGGNLGSDSENYPITSDINNGEFVTLSVSAGGILSATLTNGGPNPGAVFYDNLTVTQEGSAAPEPATAALLLPFLGLAVLRRHR